MVSYSGRPPGQPAYRCDRPNLMLGLLRCFTFGGLRVDAAVARELLRAVAPMAIEAAVEAERRYMETRGEQQRVVELELQQARYEAALAERRYAACDPDNRLIAAQLEKSWEAALRRVEACEALVQKSDCRRGQVAWGAVRQCAGTPACLAGSSGSASRSRSWPRSSGQAESGREGLDR